MVTSTELPDEIKEDMELYSGCVSGATQIDKLESILEETGFTNISIKPLDESREIVRQWSPDKELGEYILSATVEAVKP